MTFRSYFKKLLERFWIQWRYVRLRNRDFTLFSNDCIGGVITHNVGVPFNSPTVNLFFESLSQYMSFLENVPHYIGIPVEHLRDEKFEGLEKYYPVGVLRSPEHGDVVIHFMHYKDFDEALDCWNRRGKRINSHNAFAILHFHEWDDGFPKLLERFAQLPMKAKMVVTYPGIIPSDYNRGGYSVFIHPKVRKYIPGFLLHWKSRFMLRYIDDFDYVSWLNG